MGSVVYGLEADASWADASRSYLGFAALYSSKLDAFGTARGRVGLAVDRTLAYVTAGAAWFDSTIEYNSNIPTGRNIGDIFSRNRWGWAAGFGVEHAWTDAWSFKLEALYLRTWDDDRVALPAPPKTCGFNSGNSFQPCTFAFGQEAWTVRVGVNYRWGGPVRAAYY
jgi:outer membrane immunogenic protein